MMKMFEVNIYLETSLKGPGTRKGWYAAVIECTKKDGSIHKREDFVMEEALTYHRSVLLALLKSLKRLNASSDLTIHTDSSYLISNIERNLERWRGNGFRNIKGEPVKNQTEWQQVDKLLKGHKVSFVCEKRNKYTALMLKNVEKTECEGNFK